MNGEFLTFGDVFVGLGGLAVIVLALVYGGPKRAPSPPRPCQPELRFGYQPKASRCRALPPPEDP